MAILDQKTYRAWAETQDDLPLFFQPWWLDIVNEGVRWDAVVSLNSKTGKVEGVLPFRIKQKWLTLKVIGNPMLTPFNGPWLIYPDTPSRVARYSFEMRVLGDLAKGIPDVFIYTQKCHYQLQNWLPFYHLGFRQTTRYSYVLEDISDTDLVWKGMKKTHRSLILKAQKIFTFESSQDIDLLYDLVDPVFEKQNQKNPVDRNLYQKLHIAALSRGQSNIFVARNNKTGRIEGGIWVLNDGQSAYLLATGRIPDAAGGEVAALIWQAIQYYSDKTASFDFEGSMMKGVEGFFRRFGGTQKPYFQLKKGWKILE